MTLSADLAHSTRDAQHLEAQLAEALARHATDAAQIAGLTSELNAATQRVAVLEGRDGPDPHEEEGVQ